MMLRMLRLLMLMSGCWWFSVAAVANENGTQVILSNAGSGTFTVPLGVSSITVEVWGGGGHGGDASSFFGSGRSGGGGGGAYARRTFAVTPGQVVNYVVGSGSSTIAPGGDTWFLNNTQLLAKGGNSVDSNTPGGGTGGSFDQSIGDVRFAGGAGATVSTSAAFGGGGGGSAGSASTGNAGNNRIGGSAVTDGGAGGNGGTNSQNGSDGDVPGAGGGGAHCAFLFCGRSGGRGGDGQIRIRYQLPVSQCINDNFNRGNLGNDWVTTTRSGNFTPRIINNRLRMTQAEAQQSTAATLQRFIPAANNFVQLEFDYYAYGGSGADGTAIVLSNALITPQSGAFGGSLGYAQKGAGSDCPNCPGFAGGWVGIALDEYGNFSAATEGRIGGAASRQAQRVSIRGAGSGISGYRFIGNSTVLSPAIDGTGDSNPHRYRISLDSRSSGQSILSISRDVSGSGLFTPVFGPRNLLAETGQGDVPANFFLSLTGSTGGLTNIHEFGNISLCAAEINPVGTVVDHFELNFSSQGLTCNEQEITVIACANSNCSQRVTEPVTLTMSLNDQPVGAPQIISGGSGTVRIRNTVAGTVAVGVAGSNPAQRPFTQNLCRRDGGSLGNNCSITFTDSGFLVQVPDFIAGAGTDSALLKAVKKDDATQACVPGFASVSKAISFWSDYVTPGSAGRVVSWPLNINGSDTGNTAATATPVTINFNAAGEALLQVNYADAGLMQLNARLLATGEDSGLVMSGSGQFSSRPAGFCVQTDNPCSSPYENCSVLAAAGDNIPLQVRAVGLDADGDGDFCTGAQPTPSFSMNTMQLSSQLVAPATGVNGAVSPSSYSHAAAVNNLNTPAIRQSEAGVFQFRVTPAANYFGYTIPAGISRPAGRFTPARFALAAGNPGSIAPFCATSAGFAYSGQDLSWQVAPQLQMNALNRQGIITRNYTQPGFMRLTAAMLHAGLSPSNTDSNAQGVDGNLLPVTLTAQPGLLQVTAVDSGVMNYDFSALDVWRYGKTLNSKTVPFTPQLTLNISNVQDTDNVPVDSFSWQPAAAFELRYGRLQLENAYGPEIQSLTLPVRAQYWNGSRYVLNTDDSCWAYSAANATLNPAGLTSVSGQNGILLQGEAPAVVLTAPGSGNTGTVQVDYAVPVFLQDDFSGSGTLENPSGLATFGIYRGHDRIIYWREVGR